MPETNASSSPPSAKPEGFFERVEHEFARAFTVLTAVAALSAGCAPATPPAPAPTRQIAENMYVMQISTAGSEWQDQIKLFHEEHPELKIVDVSAVGHGQYGRSDALILITEQVVPGK